MKFIYGMLTGILISALFFLFYFKQYVKDINAATVAPTEIASSEASKPDNGFLVFYDRFHSDSVFQMEHIVFPLEGIPPRPEDGIIPDDFRWQKDDWIIHKLFDSMDGTYVQYIKEVGPGLVVDQIKDAAGTYGMQRRFAKMGDDWFLIYYAAMNVLPKEEE